MQKQPRIFIFKLKQLLAILTIVIFFIAVVSMALNFALHKKEDVPASPASNYIAGAYTSSIILDNQAVDIEVIIDTNHIKSASIINLESSIAAMYPLLETSISNISDQLASGITLDNINYAASSQYTSQVLLGAISKAIEKATP